MTESIELTSRIKNNKETILAVATIGGVIAFIAAGLMSTSPVNLADISRLF